MTGPAPTYPAYGAQAAADPDGGAGYSDPAAVAAQDPSLQQARAHAAAEWALLRARLQTVTPRGVARSALVLGVLAGIAWGTIVSWPALLPFVVGGIISYALLPAVNSLDRVMPRALAAAVSVGAVVGAIVLILVLVVPPLATALLRTAQDLPNGAEMDAAVSRFQASLGSAGGSSEIVGPLLGGLSAAIRNTLASSAGSVDALVQTVLNGLLGALGALVGLIVLPLWMLTVMSNQRRGRVAVDRQIAPWLRRDIWAAFTIADRATGAYLRGYVVVAALVGVVTALGLWASPRLGGPTFQEPVALAVLAGASQLIPAIGAAVGLLPALLILPLAPDRAAAYTVAYLVARFVGSSLIGSRLQQRNLAVHPAIMVPGIVVLSQFGIGWLLLAAPIITIAHDLTRYAYGRLSEPPMPAGWQPGTASATAVTPASAPATYRAPVAPQPLARAASSEAGAAVSTGR